MLNTIDDVIWSADAKTYTTLYMSQAAKKIYGLDADAFYKDKELWRNMIHPEDKHIADQKLRELEDGGKYSEVQYRIVRPDRETRNINDRCWVVEDEFGNPDRIEGIARDITIQKDREKRAANETKSKNRLISAAAHDLKNPISGIISLVDFLKDQVEGENNLELLNMMSKAGHKALHIIQDLLQIAELENENYRLKPEKSDLNFLVSTVIDHNKTEAAQKGIRLYANLLKDKIPVRIELLKFQRVLENLVSNSLKFTKEGGTIVLRTFVDGEKAVIEVEDDGIGIPAALQSSVFDQFTRAKRQGLNGEQATGLGMSIAKVIVELHKGKIGIQSEEGLGTKCIIEIPMDVQNETKTE
ncbi:PAS domain-containing sensor histidine kinase [Leptospira ellisii]|nr:PAS domain-containing sensor histidine kinase [Leptospira ellisii]MDV6235556.1 PAS domain-containing sensor histidine kinase [Leptospira ellisii]